MTKPLGPIARNLVAAARSGLDPSAESAARVRARVALAVGGVASTGAAHTPTPVAGKLAIGKLAAIVATTSALVVGGWFAMHRAVADQNAPAIAPPATLEVATGTRGHLTSTTHDELVAAPIVASTTAPRIKPAAPQAQPAPSPVASVPRPPTLAREVALIDAAIASLKASAPDAALATLAVYTRETHAHGQLSEDAAALEIDARCRARAPVEDQVSAFVARWPSSAQRARLTKSCANTSSAQ